MSDEEDLAGLIASRICHDLISPVGALGNGLELLSLSVDPKGEEMALIRDCAAAAAAGLSFMRIAFGAAADGGVSLREVSATATRYLRARKVEPDMTPPKGVVRVGPVS